MARKITPKTRMIVPVHIGGWPVDMAPLMRLAKEHDLVVLEDAAHAFGATYKGRKAGTIGHFGAYSFHEVKNINALGEGGILVSNTRYGEQFSKCRFVGLDLTMQIPHLALRCDHDRGHARAVRGREPLGHRDPGRGPVEPDGAGRPDHRRPAPGRRKAQCPAGRRSRRSRHADGPRRTRGGTHHLFQLQVDPDAVGANIQSLKCKLAERGVTQIAHFAPLYKFQIMAPVGLRHRSDPGLLPGVRRPVHEPLHALADLRPERRPVALHGRSHRGERRRTPRRAVESAE